MTIPCSRINTKTIHRGPDMSVTIAGNILVQSNGQPIPISLGGTGQTTAPAAINALLPTQTGQSGKVLTTNGTNVSWSSSAGGSPAGSDTQIQYNDSGTFGGNAFLTVNKSTGAVTSTSTIKSTSLYISDAVDSYRTIDFQTAGVDRWLLQANNTAETGSNTGSDLELVRVADNGLTQNIVYTVARNSGIVDFKVTPTINGSSIITTSTNTPSLTATQIGFGSAGNNLTGVSNFTYDNANIAMSIQYLQLGFNTTSNAVFITTTSTNDFLFNPLDITTSNTAGQFVIRGANNNSGFAGGTLTLKGGNNTNSSDGGSVNITAGNSSGTSGFGGSVAIHAGTGITAGGAVIFSTGATTTLSERFRITAGGAWSVGSTGSDVGTSGYVLTSNGTGTPPTWQPGGGGGGGGTVTSVSVTTANGVSGSVANPTTTPAITLTLGAITPSSVNASGNVTGGTVTSTGTLTASGGISLTGTQSGGTISSTRINPRAVAAPATTGTLTIDSNVTDYYSATGLTGGITFAAPTGTPVAGQKLMILIDDNGVSRSLTFNAAFAAVGVILPTATVANKYLYLGCVWNSFSSKWDVVAVAQQ